MSTVRKYPKGVLFTSPDTITIEGADGKQVKGVTFKEACLVCSLLGTAVAHTSEKMGLSQEKVNESVTGNVLETALEGARTIFVNPLYKEKG